MFEEFMQILQWFQNLPVSAKLASLIGHSGFVKGVAWDPMGKYLASQSDDKTLKIWSVSNWACIKTIKKPFEEVKCKKSVLISFETDKFWIFYALVRRINAFFAAGLVVRWRLGRLLARDGQRRAGGKNYSPAPMDFRERIRRTSQSCHLRGKFCLKLSYLVSRWDSDKSIFLFVQRFSSAIYESARKEGSNGKNVTWFYSTLSKVWNGTNFRDS